VIIACLGWCDGGQSPELRVSNHLTRTIIVLKRASCRDLLLLSNEISPGKTWGEAELAIDWTEHPGTISSGYDVTDKPPDRLVPPGCPYNISELKLEPLRRAPA